LILSTGEDYAPLREEPRNNCPLPQPFAGSGFPVGEIGESLSLYFSHYQFGKTQTKFLGENDLSHVSIEQSFKKENENELMCEHNFSMFEGGGNIYREVQ